MWRLNPIVMMGAAWATLAVLVARRRLKSNGVHATGLRAPHMPSAASRGVAGVLHRLSPTCLERALVAQRWMAAHGDERDIIIGIPLGGLMAGPAHAWLEGSASVVAADYVEIHRLSKETLAR
jgi:Transglutaminase-like superfamily